jgi:hypothetical protein
MTTKQTISSKIITHIPNYPFSIYTCIFNVEPEDFINLIIRSSVVNSYLTLLVTPTHLISNSRDDIISQETKIPIKIIKYNEVTNNYNLNHLYLITHFINNILYIKIYIDNFGLLKMCLFI